jgi:thiol-disulfide isomerase/thioredoxin
MRVGGSIFFGLNQNAVARELSNIRKEYGFLGLNQNAVVRAIKRWKVVALFFLLIIGFYGGVEAQEIKVVKFADLQKWKNDKSDTVYVINFWATWCKPCLKEMPAFESLGERFVGAKVKVLMVSLDAPTDLENKLKPYVHNNYLRNPVYLYRDPKVKQWQQKLHPRFSGTLPATLIHQGTKRYTKMTTGPMSYQELYTIVNGLVQ